MRRAEKLIEQYLGEDVVAELNQLSTDSFNRILRMSKGAGWTSKKSTQSASVNYNFRKGSSEVDVAGWHGKGSYGPGMVLMELYVDGKLTLKYEMPPIGGGKIDFNPTWMAGYKAFLPKLEAAAKIAFSK